MQERAMESLVTLRSSFAQRDAPCAFRLENRAMPGKMDAERNMPGLFDYLAWRGDLSFSDAPFNAVDNILCSILSYCPWDGIVGGVDEDRAVTVGEAAAVLLARLAEKRARLNMTFIFKENLRRLLEAVKDAPRFADTRLCAYVNHLDPKIEKQFSAITFIPKTGEPYIAFRGTDDSIIGWKEDFNMAFSEASSANTCRHTIVVFNA
jgi:hypothetical protein